MAPLDFKHMTSAKYRPGEDDAVNYYAQKRKKQYHGNESKEVKELSMKRDRKLPNLKVPVKGKKGISKFMRKKAITKAKDDLNASVQSADRKPEKYIKPDGKVGIRMVKTDKEVIKKEALNKDDKPFVKKLIGKLRKGSNTHAKQADDLEKAMKTEAVKYPHMMYDPKTGNEVKAKTPADHNKYAKMGYTHEKPKNINEVSKAESDKFNAKVQKILGKINFTHIYNKRGGMFKLPKNVKHELTVKKNDLRNVTSLIKKDTGEVGSMYKKGQIKLVVAESVDEALNLQQRMKRSRLMKRLKTRIKIGRDRARRKMANKKTLEKRAMRQARAAIAKKLTRGIPKAELTFARKQEIEKRLDKPALKNRIKRIAKRIFKDVRKKEVQRKKG